MVLVGCLFDTPVGAAVYEGLSFRNIPCELPHPTPFGAAQALIEVGHQLPGVKNQGIGLFGVSSGADLALGVATATTDVAAVVVNSPDGCVGSKLTAPVLILGGTDDKFVPVRDQRDCEQTMRNLGTSVESHFYEGGAHAVTYFGDFHVDAIHRTVDFFKRHLR
jgi:dienelactone hydrolase